jgi:hypothetical protein
VALSGTLPSATGDMIRIGANKLWGEAFAGKIDEVRVYKRALTAVEIQSDMTRAVSAVTAKASRATKASATKRVKRVAAKSTKRVVHKRR